MNLLIALLTGKRDRLTRRNVKNDVYSVSALVVLLALFGTVTGNGQNAQETERAAHVVQVEEAAAAEEVVIPTVKVPEDETYSLNRHVIEFKIIPKPKPQPKPVDNSVKGLQAYAGKKLGNDEQLECLVILWNRESNWNYKADNPDSSAYGIPQSLPGSKMAEAGSDWLTNPRTQINWGLDYIDERYGSPCNALAHSYANNWY